MYNRLSINKYFLLNTYEAVNTLGQSPLNHLKTCRPRSTTTTKIKCISDMVGLFITVINFKVT